MAGIDAVGPSGAARAPRTTRGRGGERFTLASPDPADAGQAAATVRPAEPLGMLALQEIGDEPVQDRAARRHGRALVAALGQLQLGLLDGADDPAVLQRLADLAASVPPAATPGLAEVLQAVVLRARVELARHNW